MDMDRQQKLKVEKIVSTAEKKQKDIPSPNCFEK